MSRVEVEFAPEPDDVPPEESGDDASGDADGRQRRQRRGSAVDVEIEREITKRQLIKSATTLLVVLLYMVFTLLRDREAGVVVVDPDDDAADDWAELS